MNDKRQFEVLFYGDVINCVRDENGKEYNLQELINLLMDQQATIERLQKKIDNISNSYEKFYGVKLKYAHWLQGDD